MKKVLMTNLYFTKYTGSELHILEMARLFKKKGYEVTIAVFQKAYPLLEMAEQIRVLDCQKEELEETDFDVVFVQHYPVFDFLCCKYNISYKKLIISKLSVISELEYLPICASYADLILCVSEECANEVREEIGDDSRVKVFKNSVSEEFFLASHIKKDSIALSKIAIISNHVPQELIELAYVLGDGYTVDYIGVEYTPRFVDVKVLKEYDLIITIGRTVQQCFASMTPVYVYDYFGGPGYINDDNFAIAESYNFSGRGGFGKRTSLELKEDIQRNYLNNYRNLQNLHDIAQRKYSYDVNFEQIYQELMLDNNTETRMLDCYHGIEKKRLMLYSKVVPLYAVQPCMTSQMYIDYGAGFNEEDSVKWDVTENYFITKKIEIDKSVKGIRFDPCSVPVDCYVDKVYINGKLKEEYSNIRKEFLDFDSKFVVVLTEEERKIDKLNIEITYLLKKFSWQMTTDKYCSLINTVEQEKIRLEQNSQVLKTELELSKTELQSSRTELQSSRTEIEKLNQNLYMTQRALTESRNDIIILQETIEFLREYYRLTPKNLIKRTIQFLKRKFNAVQDN